MIATKNTVRSVLLALLFLFTLVSCSTLPPAKPINNLTSIAGTWSGTVTTRRGSEPATMTITADGKYLSERASGKSSGKISLKDGKVVTERGTIYTLHEGEGKQILTTASPQGASGEFTKIK